MKSRITQLIARYLGQALTAVGVVLFGAELGADQAAGLADLALALATTIVGIAGQLADLLIHRAQRGGVLADNPRRATSRPPKVLSCHLWLAALPLLLLIGGCCESQQRGYVRADALSGVMDPVLDRHDAWVPEHAEDQIEAETWLRSSELIRETIEEAQSDRGSQ